MPSQPPHRNNRNVRASLWGTGDLGERRSGAKRSHTVAHWATGLGDWSLVGCSDRLRHKPRPRSGSTPCPCAPAHTGQRQLRLGILLGAGCGAAHRRCDRRGGIRGIVRKIKPPRVAPTLPFMSAPPSQPKKPLRYPGRSPAYAGSIGAYIQTNVCATRGCRRKP